MPDINPEIIDKPVVFEPTATKAVLGTVIAAMLIVFTGFSTLLSLMQARDVIAILKWLQGTEGLAFGAALSLLATVAWRVWVAIRKHAKALIAARAAPNRAAVVKGD